MAADQTNFRIAFNDEKKWAPAELEVKLQWVAHLHRHHSKLMDNTATDENIDLFFIKIWGLIDEFGAPLKDTATKYRKMTDIDSDFYDQYSSHDEKAQARVHLDRIVPPYFSKYVDTLEKCLSRIEDIKQKFSEEDLLLLLDYRTHIAHPTADFYRITISQSGKLRNSYRNKSRADIQKILEGEYKKHREGLGEQAANRKIAFYFASKITAEELISLGALVAEAAHFLNPLLALKYKLAHNN